MTIHSPIITTAKAANYSSDRAQTILDEMIAKVDAVIDQVSKQLPADFPTSISEPIFEGMLKMKNKLV